LSDYFVVGSKCSDGFADFYNLFRSNVRNFRVFINFLNCFSDDGGCVLFLGDSLHWLDEGDQWLGLLLDISNNNSIIIFLIDSFDLVDNVVSGFDCDCVFVSVGALLRNNVSNLCGLNWNLLFQNLYEFLNALVSGFYLLDGVRCGGLSSIRFNYVLENTRLSRPINNDKSFNFFVFVFLHVVENNDSVDCGLDSNDNYVSDVVGESLNEDSVDSFGGVFGVYE
jgi:hypothetical protein